MIVKLNPLQGLIAAAAKGTPVTGTVAKHKARTDAAGRPSSLRVVVADVSTSMAESAGASTKIALLREALVGQHYDKLIAFATRPVDIASAEQLPAPCGSTALHLALDHAAKLNPGRTLVISDGQPDDPAAALVSAELLPGVIDVLYVGREDNIDAIAFMRKLARAGSGRCATNDLRRTGGAQLRQGIATMLLPPGRTR